VDCLLPRRAFGTWKGSIDTSLKVVYQTGVLETASEVAPSEAGNSLQCARVAHPKWYTIIVPKLHNTYVKIATTT